MHTLNPLRSISSMLTTLLESKPHRYPCLLGTSGQGFHFPFPCSIVKYFPATSGSVV